MNPIVEYLLRMLPLAAFFFGVTRLITSGQESIGYDIIRALAFGLLVEGFNAWRRSRQRAGKPPYSPWGLIGLGAGCLGIYAVGGLFGGIRPAGTEWLLLLALAVPPVYLLICGIVMLWRARKEA